MSDRAPGSSRRALLTGIGAAAGVLALPGRHAFSAAPVAAAPTRRIGFALVGIGKLSQKQLIPALRATQVARLTALVSGHPDKAKPRRRRKRPRRAQHLQLRDLRLHRRQPRHRRRLRRAAELDARRIQHPRRARRQTRLLREADGGDARGVRADDRRRQEGRPPARHRLPPALRTLQPGAGPHRPGARARRAEVHRGDRRHHPRRPEEWRLDKKLAGGGSMVDIGIYALQAVRHVSGEEPISVSARATITDSRASSRTSTRRWRSR